MGPSLHLLLLLLLVLLLLPSVHLLILLLLVLLLFSPSFTAEREMLKPMLMLTPSSSSMDPLDLLLLLLQLSRPHQSAHLSQDQCARRCQKPLNAPLLFPSVSLFQSAKMCPTVLLFQFPNVLPKPPV